MFKKEQIWREILDQCLSKAILTFTQKGLAQKLGVSLSTVHNALSLPRASEAIEVTGRNFRVKDKEKFLLLWASHRILAKDILYQTHVSAPMATIEGLVLPEVIFGAFSAFVKKYKTASADYDAVYIYAEPAILPAIKDRFPLIKGRLNLIVLKADPLLKTYGPITPDAQTFVDLWSLPQWYAKDFLNNLKTKLGL